MATSETVERATDEHHAGSTAPEEALAAVHVGLWVSATRCVLTYVVAPAAGALGTLLGPLGLVLQILGAVTATSGARRLWVLRHRARIPYVAVATAVDLLVVLALLEIAQDLLR
jgi:uncharacterized membrane protein YczE